MPFEPGTFSRARQSDGKNDCALRSPRDSRWRCCFLCTGRFDRGANGGRTVFSRAGALMRNDGNCRSCCSGSLGAASAASASSPSPPPARVDASTRARRFDGGRFRILFPASRTLRCRLRFNFRFSGFGFDYSRRSHRPRLLGGIVIGRLKRGPCRLGLARFQVLFGALEAIAHPLAHVWFVTQLHISGNPAGGKRTKAASLL